MLAQAPSSALIARFGLTASPSAPYQARWHLRHALASWGIGRELVETAELITSELVTNAVKATGVSTDAGLGQVLLTLCFARQALRIEVTDGSTNPPILGQVPPDAESGRGMFIVETLSSEWSYSFLPSGHGKTVYCVLATDDRPGADSDLRAAS
jgi:anti-sigma regulatory factor (Ser/Thr protein kinase)